MNNIKIYEDDKPELKNDYLNYKKLAQNIKTTLKVIPKDSGFSCAIDGIWGIGKTTLINFLKEEIENDKNFKIKVIDFSPWNIFDDQNLINEFFGLLKRAIEEEDSGLKIKKIITQYYKIIIEGVKLLPTVNKLNVLIDSLVNHFQKIQTQTVYSLKNELYNYLKYEYEGQDLLIIIDDVDRMTDKEIMILMKLIKEIADFPHITYLLSLDKNNVAKSINHISKYPEKNKYGYNYLDKFVQLWWTLPIINSETLFVYLTEKLTNIISSEIFKFEKEYFEFICKQIIFYRDDVTFRKIKLLYNTYISNYETMGKYTNFCDLLAYTWIELFYPDLMSFIVENFQILLTDLRTEKQNTNSYVTSINKKTEEQEFIDSNIDELRNINPKNYDEYSNILYTLFPIYKFNCGASFSINKKDNDIMRLLICTRESFLNYFLQQEGEFQKILEDITEVVSSNKLERYNILFNKYQFDEIIDYLFLFYKYNYMRKDIELSNILNALFIKGNDIKKKEQELLIDNIDRYFSLSYNNEEYPFISLIQNLNTEVIKNENRFQVYYFYNFIHNQKIFSYEAQLQNNLLEGLSNILNMQQTTRKEFVYYMRICKIFSETKRYDLLIQLFNKDINYVISFIINTYNDIKQRDSNINTFRDYFIAKVYGRLFNLQNFWDLVDSNVKNDILNYSNEIKLFLQNYSFAMDEQQYKNIINCYCNDFNL